MSKRVRFLFSGYCFCLLQLSACQLGVMSGPDGSEAGTPPPNADPLAGCSSGCHGTESSVAPPLDTKGNESSSERTVGAHASHLQAAPTWHRKVECTDCHQVPMALGDAGHIDTPPPAELTFGEIAGATEWNGTSCTNAYCHGATLGGGARTEPVWTTVDGSQAACGSCHGAPPPPPHPEGTDCGACHPTMQPGTSTFLDPDSHINGKLELASALQACDSCHGSGGVAAPPRDLAGNTEITSPGVGAHRAHLGTSTWHRELYCSECHTVPVNVGDPGHMDGDNRAEVMFDTLNPTAVYDQAAASCQNLYCHGNGWSTLGTMPWTQDATLACNSCHSDNGTTMSGRHRLHVQEEDIRCTQCHDKVVDQDMTIIAPNLHIDGVHQVDMVGGGAYNPANRGCTNLACHDPERW